MSNLFKHILGRTSKRSLVSKQLRQPPLWIQTSKPLEKQGNQDSINHPHFWVWIMEPVCFCTLSRWRWLLHMVCSSMSGLRCLNPTKRLWHALKFVIFWQMASVIYGSVLWVHFYLVFCQNHWISHMCVSFGSHFNIFGLQMEPEKRLGDQNGAGKLPGPKIVILGGTRTRMLPPSFVFLRPSA